LTDLELAERAARAAGEVLMSYYGRAPEGLGSKSSATDMVSDADREAERAIRELLEAERPDDGLLAEEGSHSASESGRRWVVDPLDGTINFLYGFPAWAVSVAVEDGTGTLAGVVFEPVRGECFAAARGEGALLDGRPIRVRDGTPLERALVATGFGYDPGRRGWQAAMVARLLPRARDIRRAGAAALDLAWLAAGRVDAFYEHGLNPWDWAAGRLIAEEAGATVRDVDGDPAGLVAASSAALADELEPLVRR
jgi:myo-inositol-1(or 4)-monophosphatase